MCFTGTSQPTYSSSGNTYKRLRQNSLSLNSARAHLLPIYAYLVSLYIGRANK